MSEAEEVSDAESQCVCQIPIPTQGRPDISGISEGEIPMTVSAVTREVNQDEQMAKLMEMEQKRLADEMKQANKDAKRAGDKEQRKREKEDEKNAKAAEAREVKRLSHMIELYYQRFPNLVASFPKLSARPSKEECLDTLFMIHEVMTSQGSVKSISHLISTGLTFLEMFWGDGQKYSAVPKELRFNIRGITKRFENGCYAADLDPLLLELDIEYPWLGRRSLFARFADAMMHVILDINERNTNPDYAKLKDAAAQAPLDI